MNRELLVGEIWENLYMSRCSSTLVIKEMQIQKNKKIKPKKKKKKTTITFYAHQIAKNQEGTSFQIHHGRVGMHQKISDRLGRWLS